jgi:hypothetical protein
MALGSFFVVAELEVYPDYGITATTRKNWDCNAASDLIKKGEMGDGLMSEHYHVPIRTIAWVEIFKPSCGRICATSLIQL